MSSMSLREREGRLFDRDGDDEFNESRNGGECFSPAHEIPGNV